jgi:hypothetical protein
VQVNYFDERHHTMSSVKSSWRERRQAARTRRAINRALERSNSPTMRDELLTLANNGPWIR